MEEIKTSVMAVCAVSAGICLVENLFSVEKFRTQFTLLLRLILVAVIINPFIKGGFEFNLTGGETFELSDYGYSRDLYLNELKRQSEENISEVLKELIVSAGIECEKVYADVNISEDLSIIINRVTLYTEDFLKSAEIVKNTLGNSTEVVNGNYGQD